MPSTNHDGFTYRDACAARTPVACANADADAYSRAEDLGPAPTPPAWCEPGARPDQSSVRMVDGAPIAAWERCLGDVWVYCHDTEENGRMVRSAPRIAYNDPPADGLDAAGARQLARELMAAANTLTDAEQVS
jgi:hypothetical protein